MKNPVPIRLGPADAERYVRLRRRMLTESPWAFGASPEDSETVKPEFCRRMLADDLHVTFALEAEAAASGAGPPELIATVSVTRAKPRKHAHRAGIWAMYVEPEHRRRGLGRALVSAAIEQARAWRGVEWVDLGVSANSPEALGLYERLGFVAWGREPEATALGAQRHDEIHLTLRLGGDARDP